MTAICSACFGGHLDIVKVLHARGAATDVSTQVYLKKNLR